jgi:outer membrane protein
MKKYFLIATLLAFVTVASAQKFGYVDSKYILAHAPEYASAQATINKLSSQWQKDIETKYETIARLETALAAEKILLTDEMKRKREEDIEARKQEAKELQRQKFGVDGELFKKREELIKPIQDQIYEAIQEVASTSALMVVFDKANHSNMLYTNPKHDISDKVLRKMGLKPGDFQDDAGGDDEKEEEPSKPGTNTGTKTTKTPSTGNTAGKRK